MNVTSRVLAASAVTLLVAAGTALPAAPANANVGQCKTITGNGGSATVCLTSFVYRTYDGSSATLKVTKQTKSRSHNVYVSYGWVSTGVYSYTVGRLGPNSPDTYSKTVRGTTAELDAVKVRLCEDVPFQTDPCYAFSTIVS